MVISFGSASGSGEFAVANALDQIFDKFQARFQVVNANFQSQNPEEKLARRVGVLAVGSILGGIWA